MTDTLPRVEPRTRQERRRRRALRRRLGIGSAIAAPMIVLLVVILAQLGNDPRPTPIPVGGSAEGDQVTYLLVGTRANDTTGGADWLTLLAVDRGGTDPLTLFVPASTLTEIPGHGFDAIGKAMALGRLPLQEVAVENLLGASVDHTMVVSEQLVSRLVDLADGIEVDVPERLLAPSGTDRLVPVFEAGPQRFDGARAIRYLQYEGEKDDELAQAVRSQQIWEGLYARFEGERAADLKRIVTSLLTASPVTDAPPEDAGAFLGAFAAAGEDARTYRTLPVQAVGSGGPEDAFRVEQTRLDELVRTLLAGSLPPAGPGRGARVQVLNGNGEPETGLSVAALLVPAGFRIADTGNARSFDFKRTKIIVYRETDLPIAVRIRDLLGLGAIEISRTQQTIVDVTVVVGRDFVARHS